MKKLVATFTLTLTISASLFAQKIEVSEKTEKLNDASHPCLSVYVYETDESSVEKGLKSMLKDMNAKVSMKKEIFADDAKWSEIGDNTFDVYAKVKEVEKGKVELIFAVDLGGAFMSSSEHSSQTKAFKEKLKTLAVDLTKEGIEAKMKEEGKVLGKLEDEQKSLEKDKEKLQSNIEGWKKDIEKAEGDIKTNDSNQGTKKKEIEEQKAKVKKIEQQKNDVK